MVTGTTVNATPTSDPSLRRAVASITPPSGGSAPGTASVSNSPRPIRAVEAQPKSSSAGRLHRVTLPLRSVRTKQARTSCASSFSTASGSGDAPALGAFSDTGFRIGKRGSGHDRPGSA